MTRPSPGLWRHVTLCHVYRDDADIERTAELECLVTDPERGTRLDPPYPGDIEPRALRIDGELVHDLSGYDWLIDQIIEAESGDLLQEDAA